MREVSGEYVSQSNNLVPFQASIPGSWEELDKMQYVTVLELLTFNKADKYTISASLIGVLFGPKNWHILNHLGDEELHALVPLTNFILETRPPAINKFPFINIRKKKCAAPADDLGNLGFGEWCFLYEFWAGYIKHKDNDFLDKLIATIYRPEDPAQKPGTASFSGDTREPFNENIINERARSLKDMEDRNKQAIFAWISAALLQIMEARPNVFPVSKGESEADDQGDGDARTWLSVFRELLGPKWGTTEQLKFTNAMFVLDHLEEQRIDFDKAAAPTD